jgi:hypothetical protein
LVTDDFEEATQARKEGRPAVFRERPMTFGLSAGLASVTDTY